ncbi:MAG TPA: ABC transporter ATP-binding protein [Terriglobia bacterium]|nr:ABC transporter ATP-binding protein [Terriglobia bacterium]
MFNGKRRSAEILPDFIRLTRSFRPEIIRERKLLALGGVTVFLSVCFQLLSPWPLKFIYDRIFEVLKHSHAQSGLFTGYRPDTVIGAAALILVALAGLTAAAEFANEVILSLAATRILAEVRARLFAHVAGLSVSFHDRSKTGDLISRLAYDTDRIREVMATAVVPFLSNLLAVGAMLGVMFWMNWRLALIACAAFPAFALVVHWLMSRIKETARLQRVHEGSLAATTAEAMGSIRIVQALSLQGLFGSMFSAANTKSLKAGVRVQKLSAGLERAAEMLIVSTTAFVLWEGSRYVLSRQLTPGDLIVFVSYLRASFKPLRQAAKQLGQMAKALASGDRILDLLNTAPEIHDCPGAITAPPLTGQIQFENVAFEYQPGRPVLSGINCEISPGCLVALVGPSGSGKSTLAGLLLRFHDPCQGRILIDGVDIRNFKLDSLRGQIGFVMQDSVLFGVSVRENIAFGTASATQEQIERAARLAGAHDVIMRLPRQYETVLGERGVTLSGGQRQRLAIARAAVRDAPILILDEPTTGLDNHSSLEVMAALGRLGSGRTTLMITHDLVAAAHADYVIYLAHGKIVESGTPEELLMRRGEYAAAYRSRSKAPSGVLLMPSPF